MTINRVVALLAFVLLVVSIWLFRFYSHETYQCQLAMGYFAGTMCALLGFVTKTILDGNTGRLFGGRGIWRILDSLPFLILLPFGILIVYVETTGLTTTAFNIASFFASALFGMFFWPTIERLDVR